MFTLPPLEYGSPLDRLFGIISNETHATLSGVDISGDVLIKEERLESRIVSFDIYPGRWRTTASSGESSQKVSILSALHSFLHTVQVNVILF